MEGGGTRTRMRSVKAPVVSACGLIVKPHMPRFGAPVFRPSELGIPKAAVVAKPDPEAFALWVFKNIKLGSEYAVQFQALPQHGAHRRFQLAESTLGVPSQRRTPASSGHALPVAAVQGVKNVPSGYTWGACQGITEKIACICNFVSSHQCLLSSLFYHTILSSPM